MPGADRSMAEKNNQDKWWVDNAKRRASQARASAPGAPAGERFYAAARGFNQEQALEDLTDNNLRLVRQTEPPIGGWAQTAMAEESYPHHLTRRIKEEFRLPERARGLIVDHGRVIRLLICGPEIEDWTVEVSLSEEPTVDVYVWSTLYRERVFRRAEEALRQARRWAVNLIEHPPVRGEPVRGALL